MRTVGETLEQLAAARGVSLSELSRLIGRNLAYLQQFVRRGTRSS
jgi:repressor LexA